MPHIRNYRLLALMALMQGIVFYGPVATIYRRAYGLDVEALFLIESISWIVTLALESPWGRFADRFGYRLTIVLGNVVFLASKLVFSVAYGFSGFLAERLLLSVALSALSGCTEALLYRSAGAEASEKAFGRWNAASAAGLLAASVASPLLYASSLRMTAYGTVVPYAIAAVASLFLVDVDEEKTTDGATGAASATAGLRGAFEALARDRGLLLFVAASAVMGEAAQAATVFLAPLQYERAGIPLAAFGALYAALQVASLAAAGAWRLVGAVGRERTLRALFAVGAAALAILALSDGAWTSVAALLALAAAAALFRPLSASIQNERVIGSERATALSVNAMAAEIIAALVNVGVGRLAGVGLPAAFGALAAILGALAVSPAASPRRPVRALEHVDAEE
ncbi:MAG: MFS transporter [Spirochaetaceae bacterium]|nr:MFS transporter [Spirochaetaceae bacterium]